MGRYSFPREEHLRSTAEFEAVYDQGRSVADERLVVYCLNVGGAGRRVGFVVSKRIGNAVTRNRMRRVLRESYRRLRPRLAEGIHLVVIARPGARGRGQPEMMATLQSLLGRLGAWKAKDDGEDLE